MLLSLLPIDFDLVREDYDGFAKRIIDIIGKSDLTVIGKTLHKFPLITPATQCQSERLNIESN